MEREGGAGMGESAGADTTPKETEAPVSSEEFPVTDVAASDHPSDQPSRKLWFDWSDRDQRVLLVLALLVFAAAPWMIFLGFGIVGLAVGADIPASWSLIAEQAPDTKRGAHSGVAQVLWYLGPVVVLLAAYFLITVCDCWPRF